MTQSEILKKAIEKAVKNGYGYEYYSYHQIANGWMLLLSPADDEIDFIGGGVNDIIFSHDFAKSFWGEEKVDFGNGMTESEYKQAILDLPHERRDKVRRWALEGTQIRWQYHLQQMVLEENPINYLEKFI